MLCTFLFQKGNKKGIHLTWCGSRVVYLGVQLTTSLSFCQSNPLWPESGQDFLSAGLLPHRPARTRHLSLDRWCTVTVTPASPFHLIPSAFPFLPASNPYCRGRTIYIFLPQPLSSLLADEQVVCKSLQFVSLVFFYSIWIIIYLLCNL